MTGVQGVGKETVHYSKDRSLVSSVGEGDHDSTANAGGANPLEIDDALLQIQNALKGFF